MTPAGIEPATFRFVAQHLNHCATAVPIQIFMPTQNIILSKSVQQWASFLLKVNQAGNETQRSPNSFFHHTCWVKGKGKIVTVCSEEVEYTHAQLSAIGN